MARDIMSERAIDKEQADKVSQNSYYQKIQKELKQQNELKKKDEAAKKVTFDADEAVQESAKTANQLGDKVASIKEKASHKSLKWEKPADKSLESKDSVSISDTQVAQVDKALKKNEQTLKVLGFKIDMTPRISDLKQSLAENTVQSRSHNFFLAKFAQYKCGVIGQILSLLGVGQEELQKLQKTALKEAIEENITLMAESIYNLELTELVHGGKKAKRSKRLFMEAQRQLIQQMNNLGRQGYWNAIRMLEEKLTQCKKIESEFNKEKTNLNYQHQYYSMLESPEI